MQAKYDDIYAKVFNFGEFVKVVIKFWMKMESFI